MVTVSDLKRMADYDLAILSAHGSQCILAHKLAHDDTVGGVVGLSLIHI